MTQDMWKPNGTKMSVGNDMVKDYLARGFTLEPPKTAKKEAKEAKKATPVKEESPSIKTGAIPSAKNKFV
tara:strand:- start:1120 stop:1329 length:210 start_codon:yes stop_codon:yes gene_type:complete